MIEQRVIYADILRIVAIIGVIIIHTAGPLRLQMNTIELSWWWISNIFNSATRWSVPIFVMVSGLVLLDPRKEESIKTFLSKRLTRVLIPFIFWGIFYTILMYRTNIIENQALPLLEIFESFITGSIYFHFWFVYMLLGLYFLTPIIRVYVKNTDSNNLKYFLILWFVANGVFVFFEKISEITIGLDLIFVQGFIGYFILGHYLHITKLNKKQSSLAYVLSIISVIITVLGTFIVTTNNGGIYDGAFTDYLSPTVILMSPGIFIAFKNYDWNKVFENRKSNHKKVSMKNVLEFSSLSFGIYLIHPLVMSLISLDSSPIYIDATLINPLFGIPITALITLLISFWIIKILKRIRFLRKLV